MIMKFLAWYSLVMVGFSLFTNLTDPDLFWVGIVLYAPTTYYLFEKARNEK